MPTLRSFLKKFESPKQRMLRLSAEGKAEKVNTLLDERGLDLAGVRDKQGRTAFFLAALNGHVPVLWILWRAGADPESPNAEGQTPMQALLALPEPTDTQVRAIRFLAYVARVPFDPNTIVNAGVREMLEAYFYKRTTTSKKAAEVVGRNVEVTLPGNPEKGIPPKTIGVPRDIDRLIAKFGGKTRSRKMRRRQTRRRR